MLGHGVKSLGEMGVCIWGSAMERLHVIGFEVSWAQAFSVAGSQLSFCLINGVVPELLTQAKHSFDTRPRPLSSLLPRRPLRCNGLRCPPRHP